jgi:RND family efflux transporter MFP subunit
MSKRTYLILLLLFAAFATLGACAPTDDQSSEDSVEDESWAVTAWGEHFEIFAETDPLEQGSTSLAFTHVTALADFSPLVEGTVSAILVDSSGTEVSFSRDEPTRPGIFSIGVAPEKAGEFDLVFRVETSTRREDIPAGRARVGEPGSSGGLVEPAPATVGAQQLSDTTAISFLKEQQWRTEFATSWVRSGALDESVRGPGRVEPAAGGDVLLTSPVDGVVSATPWPYSGHEVARGTVVFRVTPRVASDRSLAELEANVAGLEAELDAAQRRRRRLEGLHELGATSRRELEEAQARAATLESRLGAATKDLATARTGRQGGTASSETVAVRAPFSGRIAGVSATPGQAVAAETSLGRLVRDRPLWVAVALRPEIAAGLGAPEGLDIRLPNGQAPLTFKGDKARLVSLSPTVDRQTGAVTAFFEVDAGVEELPIGAPVEAEILLAGEKTGVVIPETALVDDGGLAVAFVQIEGESFVRVEVAVLARQSGRVLVEGLPAGARLVEHGGNAIRRATLVAQDVGEGHVH